MTFLQQTLREGGHIYGATIHALSDLTASSVIDKMSSQYVSVRKFAQYAQAAIFSSSIVLGGTLPSCPNGQLSCQNTSAVANTCCFNAPGGQLLQTQFWDFNPATGPVDSWTVHGLWPDHCDGTYDANCDSARAYTNITQILTAAGATDLLSYMNTYWKDYQGNDESFWEHEWGKHGTCISTLEPSCYTNYTPQQEVVAYFQKAVDLFKTLPSFTWLANAGITPSTTATYTSAQVLAALKAPRGVDVSIQCTSAKELDEIWYFYNVRGSVQDGTFVPVNPGSSSPSSRSPGSTNERLQMDPNHHALLQGSDTRPNLLAATPHRQPRPQETIPPAPSTVVGRSRSPTAAPQKVASSVAEHGTQQAHVRPSPPPHPAAASP